MSAVISQTYEGAFAQGPGLEAHGVLKCVHFIVGCIGTYKARDCR